MPPTWPALFEAKARDLYLATDPSHDFLHIQRVVTSALRLAHEERADVMVVLPAAYFHDFVNIPKDDPRRAHASTLSANAAVEYLDSISYPRQYFDAIHHAIAAHSFSAGIACET
ncbi:MAG TPA: HD domain-containing protein, partial [Chloroflexota bacterium]|nr:HD domain-containing protein [Chloroflexota bacterium]